MSGTSEICDNVRQRGNWVVNRRILTSVIYFVIYSYAFRVMPVKRFLLTSVGHIVKMTATFDRWAGKSIH